MVQTSTQLKIAEQRMIDPIYWLANLEQPIDAAQRIALQALVEYISKLTHAPEVKTSALWRESLEMVTILLDLRSDTLTLLAAIVLPFYQTTPAAFKDLSWPEAQQVLPILTDAHKLSISLPAKDHKPSNKDISKLRKMLLTMVNDVRVVLVKLAECTVQLRHCGNLNVEIQTNLAEQINQLYAPLANRLGIWQLKWELEDRAFRILHPNAYKEITDQLNEKRVDRQAYLDQLVEQLNVKLSQAGVEADVAGRVKHITSIWRKMQKKDLDFSNLSDIRALRVHVKDIASCYRALSCVNELWPSDKEEFEDYIASPKANGYQSIHAIVNTETGKRLEIQIRTHAMHEASETGIAAHWRYKEGNDDASFDQRVKWLRALLDWQNRYLSELEHDTSDESIYVFTPNGQVIDLPKGATPVDFAYHVHTDVGHRTRGAKVNGRMLPLNTELQMADRVEVVTGKELRPSRDWLREETSLVTTPRARSKIQHWFRQQARETHVAQGRELLQKECRRKKVKFSLPNELTEAFNYSSVDDVLAALSTGDIRMTQVINIIAQTTESSIETTSEPEAIAHKKPSTPRKSKQGHGVQVAGLGNCLVNMAGCCHPIMGDAIEGYITQGRGVTVHRKDCKTLRDLGEIRPEHLVDANWGQSEQSLFAVSLTLFTHNRTHLIRDITQWLSKENIAILGMQTTVDKTQQNAQVQLTVETANLDQLGLLVDGLGKIPGVVSVRR